MEIPDPKFCLGQRVCIGTQTSVKTIRDRAYSLDSNSWIYGLTDYGHATESLLSVAPEPTIEEALEIINSQKRHIEQLQSRLKSTISDAVKLCDERKILREQLDRLTQKASPEDPAPGADHQTPTGTPGNSPAR